MNFLKYLIKKCPVLYRMLQRLYYFFREIIETHIFGTKIQEWTWKNTRGSGGNDFTGGYCEEIDHPHRQFVVERVSRYFPFEGLLEIGCNIGANLYLLAKRFPMTKLYGIDINAPAVNKGKAWLEQEGLTNISLYTEKADRLERFADKSVDLLLTNSTLMYIGPDKIKKVLEGMIRVTRKNIILSEWSCEDTLDNQKEYSYHDGHWVYDYKKLFEKHFLLTDVKVSRFPENLWKNKGWEMYGKIIEVHL